MITLDKKFILSFLVMMGLFSFIQPTNAKGVYQTEEDFLKEVFIGKVPDKKKLILRANLREPIEKVLRHPYSGMRIKYWQNNNQTAWILEEIGKEYPITFGLVISDGKIKKAKVLIFREIRGWEIKYPAFTRQFKGASFDGAKLDRNIDGVSGATLSVWAMTKIAKIALILDAYVNK
jgi:hypothetical protein|tara:strand:- start:1163 stop:1693 length:531 start_codon:yes stop_codon:yes gene_type:complete